MNTMPMKKLLRITGITLVVIAIAAAATAFALEKSLPYRINPGNYARYLWVGRVSNAAIVISLLAIGIGIVSRQRLTIVLGAVSLLAGFLIVAPGRAHSGGDPAGWCYFNLIRIDQAKEYFAHNHNLTNGAIITSEQLSRHIEGGFGSLDCYEHGHFLIGPVGTEPRCSFHGSMSEVDASRRSQNRQEDAASSTDR
jgi:hypothetical protein